MRGKESDSRDILWCEIDMALLKQMYEWRDRIVCEQELEDDWRSDRSL